MQGFDVFAKFLSYQRLNAYKYGDIDPVALYKWNTELSEALYPLLNTIEIALRNRLHIGISEVVNDDRWLINRHQKIIPALHDHWILKINSNIKDLAIKNKLDEGHLIAELPFGFWNVLLSRRFEYKQLLWPQLKKQVFPFARGIKINIIRDQLDNIRRLRNRIFHYEPIWHWHDLQTHYDAIIQAIEWINPVLLDLISHNRFNSIYSQKPANITGLITPKTRVQETEFI